MTKITFIDQIGRTVLADLLEQTDEQIVVSNAAVYNISEQRDDNSGRVVGMNVQLIPLFLNELLSKDFVKTGPVWKYPLASIALGTFEVDARIQLQHDQVFGKVPVQQANAIATDDANVVKLFDE